ncbi:MAG: hypothetical protein EBZ77_00825, partial [Chitinophagia bacterium]|nr:hypothetical protein [Chitinophagia bacterium]
KAKKEKKRKKGKNKKGKGKRSKKSKKKMDRAAAFHEAKWRMYKRLQNYEKAKHHAARARYYRTAFGAGREGPVPWFQAKLALPSDSTTRSKEESTILPGSIPRDHELCVMSFFEFYNRDKNAYIHMWPAHDEDKPREDWACPFHGVTDLALKRLFDFEFTETNVLNLVKSLSNTTQWVNKSGALSVRLDAASVTEPGYFKFGLYDVLGWLLPPTNDVLFPHAIDICTYLNSLFVKECKSENGQWRLTVASTQNFAVDHLNKDPGIFCRPTPKPQRAMDVIPIILRTDNNGKIARIDTTIGSRTRTGAGVRFALETTSVISAKGTQKLGCSDGYQVGAGEHLEKGEYKATRDNQIWDETKPPVPKLLANRKLGDKGPIFRALKEEVGLPEQVVGDGKVFLLGTHTTGVDASVGRDARYWPRIHGEVAYGYPRETSTALSVIVLRYHVKDELNCKPQDTKEVQKSIPIEWNTALAFFKGVAIRDAQNSRKPAFGYAHEMMLKWVNMCLVDMISEYVGRTLLISPTDEYIKSLEAARVPRMQTEKRKQEFEQAQTDTAAKTQRS